MQNSPDLPKPTLGRYLRTVVGKGIGLWTGAAVNVITWLLDKAVDAHLLGEADWWLHPEPMFYVIVISVGLAIAQFIAWRDITRERNGLQMEINELRAKTERLQEDIDRLQNEKIGSLSRAMRNPSRESRLILGRGGFTCLFMEAFLDNLAYAWPSYREGERLAASLCQRMFAVLRVRNDGGKNLVGLVARCTVVNSKEEIRNVWSEKSGDSFVLGGGHAADLNAGDFKLLVIAQAIGRERLWIRLPGRLPIHEVPAEARSKERGLRYVSGEGEVLNLASELEIAVAFKAEGLSQPERFRLGFDQEGNPTIEHLTQAKPSVNPPSTTAPAQSPPSSPESSG